MVEKNQVIKIMSSGRRFRDSIRLAAFVFAIVAIAGLCTMGTVKAQSSVKNESLNAKQQSLIRIASLASKGDLNNLTKTLNEALDAGLTVNEIKEALVHLYAYCGFPRSIRGLQTFMKVLDDRQKQGIADKEGNSASPIDNQAGTKYDRGKKVLEELTKTQQEGPPTGYSAFAPVIDRLLKEHLFADLFERDVLTYAERELVTISVLSTIGGVEPMLRSHLNICLNVGLTSNQLKQFVGVIKSTIGEKEARAAQDVLDKVVKTKK
jgi:4-carboxymuconolactone decarboxylase